jgi:hypothetical protein
MRLTLRTLLAYLDDTLEPSQASVIGQKVAESETARDLVARIKQVTRRRRLTIPPSTGPGARLDPNVIAEYLDNVLSPAKLAEVEETCLSSDVHLAEVAACHQILTLVLGEPALIPPTARMRMYRLISGQESLPDRKVPALAIGRGALEGVNLDHDDSDEALLLGLPVYQRSDKWLRWLVPIIAGCLFLAAGSAILMALISEPPGLVQLRPDASGPALAGLPADQQLEVAPPVSTEKSDKAKSPTESDKKPDDGAKKTATEPKPPSESSDKAESNKATPKQAEQPQAKTQPLSTERRQLGKPQWAGSPAGILLVRSAETGAWQRVTAQDRVFSNDHLVSLPGYRSDIRLENGLVLQLWGNLPQFSRVPVLESAVTLHAAGDVDLDFTLDHGRVVIANRKDKLPARVRIRFRNEACEVKLLDSNTEVAVELLGICPPYTPEPRKEPETRVRLYALKERLQLTANAQEHSITAPATFDWDNVFGYVSRPTAIPRPPEWWTSKPPAQTRDIQYSLDALSRRSMLKDRVELSLTEGVKEPDLNLRVLAVRFLGAIGDPAKLLDCLADERHVDVRVMAIEELRHLLAQNPQNDEKIYTVLKQKNYSDTQAQTLLQLVHGFPQEQWTVPTMRATVVEYLNSDKLAIRQIAHSLLLTVAPEGQRIRYDAAGSPDQRERGYREWLRTVAAPKPRPKSDRSK